MGVLNYKNLTATEFELMAKDVLEKMLRIKLYRFVNVPDEGLYLTDDTVLHRIVVSCKHYNSTSSAHAYNMLKKEYGKLQKMDPMPDEYYIVTSASLLPQQIKGLRELFGSLMKSDHNIITDAEFEDFFNDPENEEIYIKNLNLFESHMDWFSRKYSSEIQKLSFEIEEDNQTEKNNTKRTSFMVKDIEAIARKAGYKCSNPDCQKKTRILNDDNTIINIGNVAHIKAVAPGGPRYDKNMSEEKVMSIDNGILLCSNCHRMIDTDPEKYPAELLQSWKEEAESSVINRSISESYNEGEWAINNIEGIDTVINKTEVFICCASEDISNVYRLSNILEKNNIICMYPSIDMMSSGIFSDRVENQIKNCSYVIALLSLTAMESGWFRREIDIAIKNKKQIVVITDFLDVRLQDIGLKNYRIFSKNVMIDGTKDQYELIRYITNVHEAGVAVDKIYYLLAENGEQYSLVYGKNIVGRDKGRCDVVLNDMMVARYHAMINISEQGAIISDLQSTYGIYHNGIRLRGEQRLFENDTIRLGNTVFTFLVKTKLMSTSDKKINSNTASAFNTWNHKSFVSICWAYLEELYGAEGIISLGTIKNPKKTVSCEYPEILVFYKSKYEAVVCYSADECEDIYSLVSTIKKDCQTLYNLSKTDRVIVFVTVSGLEGFENEIKSNIGEDNVSIITGNDLESYLLHKGNNERYKTIYNTILEKTDVETDLKFDKDYQLFQFSSIGSLMQEYPLTIQNLIYQLYRIDHFDKEEEENKVEESNQIEESLTTSCTITHIPTPKDLELATQLVVGSFEEWLTNKSKAKDNAFLFSKLSEEEVEALSENTALLEGVSIDTTKHAHRQTTGLQFGYDIGMNTGVNGIRYRLCFECKNYTSLDADQEINTKTTLKIDHYAYNLIQFYMHCKKDIENRWILVCPFGDLGNDFQEKLFDEWNEEHPYMQIYAFTQKQTGMTCEKFLSLNSDAYQKVYGKDVPEALKVERESLMQDFYEMVIGKQGVEKNVRATLQSIGIPDDFICHGKLMSVLTEDEERALHVVLASLNISDKQGTYIVGEYGSGKTWLSCQIVEEIVRKNGKYPFFPVYAPLKKNILAEIDKDEMNADKISMAADAFIAEFPKDKLIEYKVPNLRKKILFILDGFDEVLSGLSETDNKIEFLYDIYSKLRVEYGNSARFLITSRESDYAACVNHDDFTTIIEDFDTIYLQECSLDDACESLKTIGNQQGANSMLKQQFQNIDQHSDIVRLAQRPVILSLIQQIASKGTIHNIYKDEFDIIKDVVSHSVEDTVGDKNSVIIKLEEYALKMSRKQNALEIEVDESFEKLIHNGAIAIIHMDTKDDSVRYLKFHHNIIREYLVASALFRALENERPVGIHPNTTLKPQGKFLKILVSMQLTPEMQKFFHRFIANVPLGAEYINLIERTLEKDSVKRNKKLASALLSLLLQPTRSLQGTVRNELNLSGIQAENLNVWGCTLENINFQNASITNMQLLDAELSNIDFRGANLEGLRLGADMPLSDINIQKKGGKHLIDALYQNGQVIEYIIDNLSVPEKYKPDTKEWDIPTEEYTNLEMVEKEMIFYNSSTIYLPDQNKSPYSMTSGKIILQIGKVKDTNFIIYKDVTYPQIVFWNKIEDTSQTVVLKNIDTDFCVLPNRGILLKENQSVFYSASDQTSAKEIVTFDKLECFVAKMKNDSDIILYTKTGNTLHMLLINSDLNVIDQKEWEIKGKFKESGNRMHFISEKCLCVTTSKTIYLLMIMDDVVNSYSLQTKVNCKGLCLENEDGSRRVKDNLAYELLKRNNTK